MDRRERLGLKSSTIVTHEVNLSLARVLLCLDDIPTLIVNVNEGTLRASAMLRVSGSVADCIRLARSKRPKGQRVGNQIDTTFISTRADLHAGAEVIRNASG